VTIPAVSTLQAAIYPEWQARPHDLLWLRDPKALIPLAPATRPSWAVDDWMAAAPVVVRRQKLDDSSLLPVGLRGRERHQRLAASVSCAAITHYLSPEMLARTSRIQFDVPALEALAMVRPLLDALGLPWGPAGGVGFALATGLPVVHAASDLDLVLRAASPLDQSQTDHLAALLHCTACRIDLQIDTGRGGFSFAEWMTGRERVLLKTDNGPLLICDPWEQAAQAA
jgi:phosphoribosyl-dephospho-CoA transferase